MKQRIIAAIAESYYFLSNVLHYVYDIRLRYSKMPKASSAGLVILGNGPSLKSAFEKHLKLLQSIECMCVNKFSLSSYYEAIKPKYYVFLDPWFFSSDSELDKLEAQVAEDIRNTSKQIVNKTKWPITIFLPISLNRNGSSYADEFSTNPNISVCYYRTRNYRGKSQLLFYKEEAGIVGGMNVLHAALSITLQMGYKQIAITGADHSWHEKIKFSSATNSLYLEDTHFNRVLTRTFSEMKTTIANEMHCLSECFQSYVVIKEWAASSGSIIYNCSDYSFIDTFLFRSLDEFSRNLVESKTR